MAENPLLPNAELRALLTLTRRCLALDAAASRRKTPRPRGSVAPLPSREALLSSTAIQLKPGDVLLGEPGDQVTGLLAPTASSAPTELPDLGRGTPRLLLAAAMAAALKHAGTDRIVLVYAREASGAPEWLAALTWAQERQLPLVIACSDPRGDGAFRSNARASQDAFTWGAVSRGARKIKLPVLTVDGEDAVAVYRAMQESVLRARSGGGPALLWAMLPSARDRASRRRSAHPVHRLEQYLRTRKIPV